MIKVFSSAQIREIDKYTIDNEPIKSIDLMDRAAMTVCDLITNKFNIKNRFCIVAGPGNNGGDGLVIARLLLTARYKVDVFSLNFTKSLSADCETNLNRLTKAFPKSVHEINTASELQIIENSIIVDAIFGSGLSRKTEGKFAQVIKKINNSGNFVLSIDIPSGLFGEDNTSNNGTIVEADMTYTIQIPPLSSMFAENARYFGKMEIVPIGLSQHAIDKTKTDFYITENSDIKKILKLRKRFDHKGNYGHALLIAGKYGTAGAAVLASKACLRSGVGLLTVHVPGKIADIIQISVPEAMLEVDYHEELFTEQTKCEKYSAIGIGPGIGTDGETVKGLKYLLKNSDLPLVIDADGLNILSCINNFKSLLKPGTIITPHPKEFERLFGSFKNTYHKIKFMQEFSFETGVIVVLKGGYTIISLPDKRLFFNTGGNPGMATGGSGDVLTGIIASFLAQSYSPEEAALASVFVHSKAGDIASAKFGQISLIASDIVDCLPEAFKLYINF